MLPVVRQTGLPVRDEGAAPGEARGGAASGGAAGLKMGVVRHAATARVQLNRILKREHGGGVNARLGSPSSSRPTFDPGAARQPASPSVSRRWPTVTPRVFGHSGP